MHRRRVVAVTTSVLLCVAAVALAGCASSGSPLVPNSSGATGGSGAVDKGVAPDTSTPSFSTAPASTAPASSPPTASGPSAVGSPRAATRPPGLRDFSDASFAVPSGFQVSNDYHPLTPLETDYISHYVVPTDSTNTKEVIGVYVYTLPAARTVTAKTDQPARITAYNARSKAVVRGSIRRTASTIDGLPAYTETATEPGGFTYIAYWAFGTHHVLQFSCQLGSPSAVAGLAVACGTTLASLRLD